ncbi:MAG: M14 family metallopeptidase [Candidatus Saccharicenans sp.]|uniref:M14 family metallopeptidase n=1 Tax=Candidatus Saccharicenans sp. TaxID=2819258 RepID=UPI00404A226A
MIYRKLSLKTALLVIFGFLMLASRPAFSVNSADQQKSQPARNQAVTEISPRPVPENLLTIAEKSNFKATSRYQEVLDLIQELQKTSPSLIVENIGLTAEGRSIPMLVLSNPPIPNPQTARNLKKMAVYIQANIHAGEVEGKEASLMLAREILLQPDHPYLQNLVILIVPNLNADGNERISPENRRQQPGPEQGVGLRQNALNLDLNRDAIKLESPEMRAVVKNILNRWDPFLIIDCHTTDGAYHEETVTYSWPLNPNSDPELLAYQRQTLLPAIVKTLKERYHTLAVPYGMFRDWRDPTKGWVTFEPQPRYFTNYTGLRNRISILDENYVHADYRTRVMSCFYFLKAILDFASTRTAEMQKMVEEADRRTVQLGLLPEGKQFAVEFELQPLPAPVTINAYELEVSERPGGGFPQLKPTDRKKPVTVPYLANYVPKRTVPYPFAYLVTVPDPEIKERLLAHGLLVEALTTGVSLEVEVFLPKELKAAERPFQGHRLNQIKGEYRKETRNFPAGTLVVRTAQPLGFMAACLLEPESDDGLVVWNFFDRYLAGQWQRGLSELPVYRLLQPTSLPALRLEK